MKLNFLFHSGICIVVAGLTLYATIDKNNQLTALQLVLPQLEKEVKIVQKKNERLQYEIDQFESPLHLMELLRKPEFSHLKYPYVKDIMILSLSENKEEHKE